MVWSKKSLQKIRVFTKSYLLPKFTLNLEIHDNQNNSQGLGLQILIIKLY